MGYITDKALFGVVIAIVYLIFKCIVSLVR